MCTADGPNNGPKKSGLGWIGLEWYGIFHCQDNFDFI